jgi:hypothetical protein
LRDPRDAEADQRQAADDARVYGLRLEMLDQFVTQARQDAGMALNRAVETVEHRLLAEAREAAAAIANRMLAGLRPVLLELHAAGAKVACLTHPESRRAVLTVPELPE